MGEEYLFSDHKACFTGTGTVTGPTLSLIWIPLFCTVDKKKSNQFILFHHAATATAETYQRDPGPKDDMYEFFLLQTPMQILVMFIQVHVGSMRDSVGSLYYISLLW